MQRSGYSDRGTAIGVQHWQTYLSRLGAPCGAARISSAVRRKALRSGRVTVKKRGRLATLQMALLCPERARPVEVEAGAGHDVGIQTVGFALVRLGKRQTPGLCAGLGRHPVAAHTHTERSLAMAPIAAPATAQACTRQVSSAIWWANSCATTAASSSSFSSRRIMAGVTTTWFRPMARGRPLASISRRAASVAARSGDGGAKAPSQAPSRPSRAAPKSDPKQRRCRSMPKFHQIHSVYLDCSVQRRQRPETCLACAMLAPCPRHGGLPNPGARWKPLNMT